MWLSGFGNRLEALLTGVAGSCMGVLNDSMTLYDFNLPLLRVMGYFTLYNGLISHYVGCQWQLVAVRHGFMKGSDWVSPMMAVGPQIISTGDLRPTKLRAFLPPHQNDTKPGGWVSFPHNGLGGQSNLDRALVGLAMAGYEKVFEKNGPAF